MRKQERKEGVPAARRSHSFFQLSEVSKSGWLVKRSDQGLVKNWRKRWVVVSNNLAYYFSQPNDSTAKGVINLDGAQLTLAASFRNKPNVININTRTARGFYLYSEVSDAETETWYDHLQAVANASGKSLRQQRKLNRALSTPAPFAQLGDSTSSPIRTKSNDSASEAEISASAAEWDIASPGQALVTNRRHTISDLSADGHSSSTPHPNRTESHICDTSTSFGPASDHPAAVASTSRSPQPASQQRITIRRETVPNKGTVSSHIGSPMRGVSLSVPGFPLVRGHSPAPSSSSGLHGIPEKVVEGAGRSDIRDAGDEECDSTDRRQLSADVDCLIDPFLEAMDVAGDDGRRRAGGGGPDQTVWKDGGGRDGGGGGSGQGGKTRRDAFLFQVLQACRQHGFRGPVRDLPDWLHSNLHHHRDGSIADPSPQPDMEPPSRVDTVWGGAASAQASKGRGGSVFGLPDTAHVWTVAGERQQSGELRPASVRGNLNVAGGGSAAGVWQPPVLAHPALQSDALAAYFKALRERIATEWQTVWSGVWPLSVRALWNPGQHSISAACQQVCRQSTGTPATVVLDLTDDIDVSWQGVVGMCGVTSPKVVFGLRSAVRASKVAALQEWLTKQCQEREHRSAGTWSEYEVEVKSDKVLYFCELVAQLIMGARPLRVCWPMMRPAGKRRAALVIFVLSFDLDSLRK